MYIHTFGYFRIRLVTSAQNAKVVENYLMVSFFCMIFCMIYLEDEKEDYKFEIKHPHDQQHECGGDE